jgi:replicative DNA helicase
MKKEQKFNKKQNIDKWMDEYCITLSKLYKYTMVNTCQLNRTISTVERQKFNMKNLEPQTSDIKDTSSVEEASDMIYALFNPNTFSNVKEHNGYIIPDWKGYYRSVKIIKSRYTLFPITVALFFDPKACRFIELPRPSDTVGVKTFQANYL